MPSRASRLFLGDVAWWALAGVAAAVAFRQLAADHVGWIREEAPRNPQWWNRSWQVSP